MKTTEKILAVVTIIGIVLKLLFLPGGVVTYTFSLTLLSSIYFIFGFALFNHIRLRNIFKRESYSDIKPIKIILAIFLGLSLSIIIVGIIFKLNHWPGANFNLAMGLVSSLILLIVNIILLFKTKDKDLQTSILRIVIVGGIGLFMFLSSGLVLEKIQFRKHPKYLKLYEQYLNDPFDEVLEKELQEELYKIRFGEEEAEMIFPKESSDSVNY